MKQVILWILVILALIKGFHLTKDYFSRDYRDKTYLFMHKAGQEIGKRHELRLLGVVGEVDDEVKGGAVKRFSLHFKSSARLSLEEVRALVVQCTEEFLGKINSNKKLRPHLLKYPVTFDEAFVTIDFSYDTRKEGDGYISCVYKRKSKNLLCYEKYDRGRDESVFFLEESYPEALRLTCAQRVK